MAGADAADEEYAVDWDARGEDAVSVVRVLFSLISLPFFFFFYCWWRGFGDIGKGLGEVGSSFSFFLSFLLLKGEKKGRVANVWRLSNECIWFCNMRCERSNANIRVRACVGGKGEILQVGRRAERDEKTDVGSPFSFASSSIILIIIFN